MNKNDYTYKFRLPMMDDDIKQHLESTWQRRIRLEWQKVCPSQAIIVLDLIVMKTKHYTNCVIQLVKLNLTDEEIETFVKICNDVCQPEVVEEKPKVRKRKLKGKTKVLQYDLSGNIIKEWDTQSQAAKELGISQSSISLCISGQTKKAGGFVFQKVNS